MPDKKRKNKNKSKVKSESVFNSPDFKGKKIDTDTDIDIDKLNTEISETSHELNEIEENKTENSNAIFFEKFEKSKKDFIKEKRKEKNKAKKSISSRNRLMGFENRLRDDQYFRRFWIILITVTIVLLVYVCIVEGFLGPHFSSMGGSYKWAPAVNLYGGLTKTSIILSGIVICLIPLPYIFLSAVWFIGVNNVHRSRIFILSNLTVVAFSTLLVIIIIPLSSYVFNQVIGFSQLSS